MEYVTIIMAIIDAIRECMEQWRREDQIVEGLLAPGFVETVVIRVSIRRAGVKGRRNRQRAFDDVLCRLESATRPEVTQFVRIAATGNAKRRATLARNIAETMPQSLQEPTDAT